MEASASTENKVARGYARNPERITVVWDEQQPRCANRLRDSCSRPAHRADELPEWIRGDVVVEVAINDKW